MISGLPAGIAGIIVSSRLDAGNCLFGADDLLDGGGGGRDRRHLALRRRRQRLGTAIGVVIISSIYNGLLQINVPDFWQKIVVGVIIIAAVAVDQICKAARLAVR